MYWEDYLNEHAPNDDVRKALRELKRDLENFEHGKSDWVAQSIDELIRARLAHNTNPALSD